MFGLFYCYPAPIIQNTQSAEVPNTDKYPEFNENIKALWLETSANLYNILKDKDSICIFLDRAQKMGFNTIIPEAKNSFGYVIFNSKIAPRVHTIDFPRTWPDCYPAPNTFLKEDFDILQTLIEEAHKRNIKVLTAINIFSEGLNSFKIGPAFINPKWQSIIYTAERTINTNNSQCRIYGVDIPRGDDQLIIYTPYKNKISPCSHYGVEIQITNNIVTEISDRLSINPDPGPLSVPIDGFLISAKGKARQWILDNIKINDEITISDIEKTFIPSAEKGILTFVNPANPEVIEYELKILEELTKNYDIDGVILDRARYSDIYSDFSPISKKSFEKYLNKKITNWPEDIIQIYSTDYWFDFNRGPLFNEWISFRAKNIYDFMVEAQKVIRKEKPEILFINYVAAWYPSYWQEGVNWAAKDYQPYYNWTNQDWPKYGIADLFDYLMVGVYYSKIYSSNHNSVVGGVKLAKEITQDKTKIIPAILISLYKGDLTDIIKQLKEYDDFMIFDASSIDKYEKWMK